MTAPASSSSSVTPHAGVIPSVPTRRPPGWTAWAGLGYLALSFAGLALAPLPDLGAGSDQVQRFLTSASLGPYAAGGLAQLLAYLFLLMFAVGVTAPAREAGQRGTAVILAPTGVALAMAAITAAAALVGAVVLSHHLPAPTAQVVLVAGSLATWLSVVGIAVALAALATLGPGGTSLPTWVTRGAALVAILLAAAVPVAETSWAHVPALLLDLWLATVAVILLRRRFTSR